MVHILKAFAKPFGVMDYYLNVLDVAVVAGRIVIVAFLGLVNAVSIVVGLKLV